MVKLRKTAMLAVVTSIIVMWAGLMFVQPVQAMWAQYTRYYTDVDPIGWWVVQATLDSDTKTLAVSWSGPDRSLGSTYYVFVTGGSTLYVRVDEWYNGQYWGYHWLQEGIYGSYSGRVFDYRTLWPPYTYDAVQVRVTWHYIKFRLINILGVVIPIPIGEKYISVQVDFGVSPYTFY